MVTDIYFVCLGYTECGRLGIGLHPKTPYVVTPQLVQGLNNIIKVFFLKMSRYLAIIHNL